MRQALTFYCSYVGCCLPKVTRTYTKVLEWRSFKGTGLGQRYRTRYSPLRRAHITGCPLWVISGHVLRKRPCPLYPQ